MKNRIKNGEVIEMSNEYDIVHLYKGHNDYFCLWLNGKVIKSTKTWKPIEKKLNEISDLKEIK